MIDKILIVGCALTFAAAAHAESLPDPYKATDAPTIGPAPVPVMEQVFWVQVNVPPTVPIKAVAPEGVELLDRTKPGKGRTRTRLYFRSDRGVKDGKIVLQIEGKGSVTVPLNVRTYREDIEEQIKRVPGVDPSARKVGRSYYTDDFVAIAKRNLKEFPDHEKRLRGATAYDAITDEEIFAALPSWSVPRQCYSNWPCPYCGEKIYRRSGFYPWQLSPKHPFKAACPICKKLFPTNDFANGDLTSGEFPDDGWGWGLDGADRTKFSGWVAYYNHRTLWQRFGGQVHRLALRYLLLGDAEAAHKAGVLLSRMAYVYPGMNMRWQQVRKRYLRNGRLLVDGNWERNQILVPCCRAYDAIFDFIDKDQRLVEFLGKKDSTIQSPADVKALIDTYMVQCFGWDWIRRGLSGGNMGAREEDMAQFAVCANMGKVSDRWIEELFTHAYNSGANRGGFDDETLVNTMTREGPVWISALGYAYGYLASKSDMAEILSRVTSPRWKARCDLYDPRLYPKLRAEFDTWIDFLVAGQFGPNYGDSGSPVGARYAKGIPAQLRDAYERAYRRWPTDKLARAIYRLDKQRPDLFEEDIWPKVEEHAKKIGPEPPLESRAMDGVGFVFLESRPYAKNLTKRAGVAMRYGYGRGHHHQDNLNIDLFAKGLNIAPELGYPCWAHPMGNTSHVAHHNTGMIDRSPQYRSAIARGDLEMFAAAPEASFADVSAAPDGFPNRMYRRAVCLADAPGDNVYLLDILRLAGGAIRTCCVHGPPHDDFQSNVDFKPGPEKALNVGEIGRKLANNIVEPQFGSSDSDAWGDWRYDPDTARKGRHWPESEGVANGDGMNVHLRLTHLGRPGRKYTIAKCAKTDIPPISYFFAEEEGKDGASEFISLWQPYEGKPFIEKIERLTVEGARPGELQPVAVRVTVAGGQVDTFLYTHQTDTVLRCGDLEFKGLFGYWSELNGKPRAMHLVNGQRLRKGDIGVSDVPPSFRAKIAAVDHVENTIALDAPLPDMPNLKGRLIYIRAGQHRTAYHIASILDDRKTIKLDLNAIIFQSKMVRVGEDRKHVVTEILPPIEASRGIKPGYYNGTVLTGEDRKAVYRVTGVEKDRVMLDRPVAEEDFPDVDGDGRRMVRIYDFGPGDEVAIHRSVFKSFVGE